MNNKIINIEENYKVQDTPKITGTFVMKDEDGNIIVSGHNMIVLSGRQYILSRCFTSATKGTFKFFLANKTDNTPITADTKVADTTPIDLTVFGESKTNIEGITVSEDGNLSGENTAIIYSSGNNCYLQIKRTLKLVNAEKLTFNSFGLKVGQLLFSQAVHNTVTMNSKRKVTLIYTLRF